MRALAEGGYGINVPRNVSIMQELLVKRLFGSQALRMRPYGFVAGCSRVATFKFFIVISSRSIIGRALCGLAPHF